MSLDTWKAEFYPIEAVKAAELSEEEVIQHSLRKWIGLRGENLKKHTVKLHELHRIHEVRETDSDSHQVIDDSSCSLCMKYRDYDYPYGPQACQQCSISRFKNSGRYEPCLIEFTALNSSPEPMIKLLEDTLDYVKRKA